MLDVDIALYLPDFRLAVRESIPLDGITAVMGASGSGKTTFLRVLAGLEPTASGTIRFAGEVWQDELNHLAAPDRRVGVVFQDVRLFPHLDVAGNLGYGAKRRGVTNENLARVAEALQITPLMNRQVGRLSGGEARRVAVARALASDPRLLLLDEPLSGLDAERRLATMRVIGDAVRTLNIPAIYVSHSESEVAALADQTLGFGDGRSTGWQTPPMVFNATTQLNGDRVVLSIGDANIPAPSGTRPNLNVELAIAPEDIVLSEHDPGRSSAAICAKATVVGASDDELTLNVFGQDVVVARSGSLDASMQRIGIALWLTARKFWIR